MAYMIEPDLPIGKPYETKDEARARRLANRPLRDKFAEAVKGKETEGFNTREAAETVMRTIDFKGVPVRISEYLPLHMPWREQGK